MSSANVIKSYLVSLSAETDMASFTKLDSVLAASESSVRKHVGGIVGELLGFQIAATSAFATAGFAVIGYIDHLAMLDQKQKMQAAQNMMSVQQYRAVSNALDIMGVSLDDVFFGTKQMQDQFHTLIDDQKQLSAMVGPDYEKQMAQVRDVINQLQRLELKAQWFGMLFTHDLLKKLGFGDDGTIQQLQRLNEWIMEKMPEWADELSEDVIPVLKEFWAIVKAMGPAALQLRDDFVTLVAALEGDEALENKKKNWQDFARAIEDVAHAFAHALVFAEQFEHSEAKDIEGLIHYGRALKLLATGHFDEAGKERDLGNAAEKESASLVPTWASSGAALDAMMKTTPTGAMSSFLDSQGLASADLISRIIKAESNGDPNATSKVGAHGLMQLMPDTARQLGVDINDPAQNVAGGTELINRLLKHYGGNVDYALAAYNMGEGKLDSYMKTGHYTDSRGRMASRIPDETMDYVKKITGDTLSVTVQIGNVHTATPEQITPMVRKGVTEALQERDRRHMAELNGAYN